MDQAPELPGYAIRGVLGAGGFGTVYLAVQERLQREVALKILNVQLGDATSQRRFKREAQVLASLNHPNLVQVYDFQDGQPAYLALEYLPGGTLKDRLAPSQPRMVAVQVVALARDLLNGLAVLHEAGLLHRDVKPANILFRTSGQAVLSDLGLTRNTASDVTRLTRAGLVVGTAAYLAPETFAGQEATPATDIFAVGVTLYEALCGRHPTDHRQIPPGFRPDFAGAPADAPPRLVDLIRELMEPNPDLRPTTAREVVTKLKSRSLSKGSSTRQPTVPRRRWRRAGLAFGGAALLAALGFAAARLAPLPPPTLAVEPVARGLRVRADRARDDFELQAYERAMGKLVKSVKGARVGNSTIFEMSGLEPDASYDLALTEGPPGPSRPPIATQRAHTQAEVEVLGLDDPGRALWLRCVPKASVHESGVETTVPVGDTGGKVPLRSLAPTVLELAFPSGTRATLTVRPPPSDAPLPIALMVNGVSGNVWEGAQVHPLLDWIVLQRPAYVCFATRADGEPALDRTHIEELHRGGVPSVLCLDPHRLNDTPAWLADARALSEAGALTGFAVEPMWVKKNWETDRLDATIDALANARAWVKSRLGAELIVPSGADLVTVFRLAPKLVWSPKLGPIIALDRGDHTEQNMPGVSPMVHTAAKDAGVGLNVKTIFSNSATVSNPSAAEFYEALRADRDQVARGLPFHREDFPEATVIYPLDEIVRKRKITGAWTSLETMARSLAGLKFQRRLVRTAPPRLDADTSVHGLLFRGAARRASVMINPESTPQPVIFTPARPGNLYVLDPKSTAPAAPRALTTTAPIDLRLEFPPVVHVEWSEVDVTAAPADAVRLVQSR